MQHDDKKVEKKAKKPHRALMISIPLTEEHIQSDTKIAKQVKAQVFVINLELKAQEKRALSHKLDEFDSNHHFYIMLHSNNKEMQADQFTPQMLAEFLHQFNLQNVKRISLVMCEGEITDPQTKESFAKTFHHTLGKQFNIYLEVSAYTSTVDIRNNKAFPSFLNEGETTKRSASKIIYAWKIDRRNGEEMQMTMTLPTLDRHSPSDVTKENVKPKRSR